MNHLDIPAADLPRRARALLKAGHRLALVSGKQIPAGFEVDYVFTAAGSHTELRLQLAEVDELPSLATWSFSAGRFEREIADLYGIQLSGHPRPRRLVRHHHWPKNWYPMRADVPPPEDFGDPEGPYPFLTVEGPGVYEIPVGPVHAGLIEPGHFRFSVVGETIVKLKARLWFVHKGIERLFEERTPADGLPLAERISGDTTIGHAIAYCKAVESACGATVSPKAAAARAILLELERLYNHVTDIGALCNDVAFGVLNAQAGRVRERLLRLNDTVTGHRLMHDAVRPGGATLRALPSTTELDDIGADIAEIVAIARGHSVVVDRFHGTAPLAREAAADLGTLGYVAKASGLAIDARADHPTGADHDVVPITREAGDVEARFDIRVEEIAQSLELIKNLLKDCDTGDHDTPLSIGKPGTGVGLSEGWRGTIAHRVDIDADGRFSRVKIVDPSFFNWPALPVALTGAIVPDFPLVNKSFNLSYAGNDL